MTNSVILLVDDDPINVKLLSTILKREGYDSISANNGLDAIEKVKTSNVGLIVMDLKMPVMDGKEASMNIRSINANIPIIASSAINSIDDNGMFDDFVSKPIDRVFFLSLVKKYYH